MKSSKTKKIICIVVAAIVVITAGIIAAVKLLNKDNTDSGADNNPVAQVETTTAEDATEDTNSPSGEEITDPDIQDDVTTPDESDEDSAEETTASAGKPDSGNDSKPQNKPSSGTTALSKAEIVALYNEAANKVKTDAKKVTRNFKNTRYDTSKSVLPPALQSMANPMIEKYVKDEVEPVHYLTKEDIIENYPAPKQTYSSKLTAADVSEATCVDNGKEYVITLKLASCKNPTAGVKVGAACHIMDVTSIKASDSSMIKKFDAIYEGCVIRCKIDKATNRVTWANFYTPFTIDAVIKLFSEVTTIAVMSYERDYTITY